MSFTRTRARIVALPLLIASSHVAHAAVPAPNGPHPRLWLDAPTLAGLKSAGAKGAVAKGAKRCADARNDPASYTTGGWQGFEFVTTLSGCLVSWEASGNADDLTTAIKYFNVLLDDYQNVGDGAGGDDVVTHDTGYAMRTFAPYAALAYDWLHDAPGVSVDLRTHARERFDAWVSYYASSGYLRDMPGSNYEAGFAFAATLISIAEGGEAGAAGDSHWATVRDQIWGKDLTPGFAAGGVLQGGDWPEGWQYGPLSVLEHALATRAMQDNGAPVAGASAWADSLVQRFANGLTPSTQQAYAAGDTEATTTNIVPDNGPLLAVIAGPASETARSWARKLDADLALSNDNPLFDALAAARAGANTAPANAPTSYTAAGTGNFYVRGAWTKDTAWSVFQCSRRLVDDHQHNDAGNFVLTRGADDLVVDPSPYGSLSTLTGNAPAVDSAVLPDGYSPSQAGWGQTTKLVWSKQSTSGIAVARCDYADQFRTEELPTDVPHALRDYVMVPSQGDGTVVLIDRVVTGAAGRSLHLRVRTPANLALDGDVATTTVGASALSIQRVYTSSGSGTVRDMPTTPECSSDNRGTCDTSRLPSGQEYRLDVAGPEAVAIHVMDAHAASAVAPTSTSLTGTGYRGVLVTRSTGSTAVIATDKADGSPVSTLTYSVPAGSGAVHVVVDAPAGDGGRSDVAGVVDGSNCKMTVTPHAGTSGGYDGHGLVVRVSSTCAVSDDGVVAPLVTSTSGTPTSTTTTGTPSGSSGTSTTASDGGSAAQSSSSGSTSAGMGVGGAATSDDGGGTPSFGAPSVGPSSAGSTNGINPTTPVTGGCAIRGGIPHDASAPIAAASCIGALVLGRRRKARRAARVRA